MKRQDKIETEKEYKTHKNLSNEKAKIMFIDGWRNIKEKDATHIV
jgi:hypothetical protein